MQREGHHAVGRGVGLVVAVQQLDVDVLVEGAGEPVARGGEDAPAPAVPMRERDRRVLGGGIAEPEEWECLQRPVQQDRTGSRSAPRRDTHAVKVRGVPDGGKERTEE